MEFGQFCRELGGIDQVVDVMSCWCCWIVEQERNWWDWWCGAEQLGWFRLQRGGVLRGSEWGSESDGAVSRGEMCLLDLVFCVRGFGVVERCWMWWGVRRRGGCGVSEWTRWSLTTTAVGVKSLVLCVGWAGGNKRRAWCWRWLPVWLWCCFGKRCPSPAPMPSVHQFSIVVHSPGPWRSLFLEYRSTISTIQLRWGGFSASRVSFAMILALGSSLHSSLIDKFRRLCSFVSCTRLAVFEHFVLEICIFREHLSLAITTFLRITLSGSAIWLLPIVVDPWLQSFEVSSTSWPRVTSPGRFWELCHWSDRKKVRDLWRVRIVSVIVFEFTATMSFGSLFTISLKRVVVNWLHCVVHVMIEWRRWRHRRIFFLRSW